MNKTIEKLWNDYFSEECASVTTEEHRRLTRRALELHEEVAAMLNKEQETTVEKYIDAIADIEEHFVRGAFFKGCEFAISLLLELGFMEK